ncbi:TetR/AcrR family transcriptional regulator [Roseomonas rosulenta]|uniref:TetR/AcrR family transcriptional regulator n=1 Tax=Roseomonas rosulenta TaxID=2748667 RepID=UPI0018DF0D86|nr:TetR/AcrR family transcriptional regulator [Roseomonas rosulenta]
MKVSRDRSDANRRALVEAARRLFRQHGFAGVTVGEIAQAAGLTHGAFYSHFATKRDIEAEAIASMIAKAAEDWRAVVAANPEAPLPAIIAGYLAFDHTSEGDVGCAFAALGSELARASDDVRAAAAKALPLQLDLLASLFPHDAPEVRRSRAMAVYAGLVGAATMAKALDDTELVQELVAATTRRLLGG